MHTATQIKEIRDPMTLIVTLNIALAAVVVIGIVTLLSRSILSSHVDGSASAGRGGRSAGRGRSRGRRAGAPARRALA